MTKLWLALFSALLGIAPAQAQNNFTMPPPAGVFVGGFQVVTTCGTGSLAVTQGFGSMDTSGKLCVNATTTVGGFTPNGNYATLTATGSSASVALPAGTTVLFQNTGTTAVSCTLGIGSATATTNEIIIQAGGAIGLTPGSNTFGACIDQTGSVSNLVVLAGGSGLAAAGGGGGGGGAAITNYALETGGNLASILSAVNNPLATQSPIVSIGGVGIIDSAGVNVGTVKAASTAAVATDKALVVSIIPGATTGLGATGTPMNIAAATTTNAGAATVKGGVGVVNGGSMWNTIAASQTNQVLSATQAGGTGATGDYLSHCVIQPTTTAAGTVTILDNATTVFTFTTGTLSNLASISVPIGAVSTSGAWKVTTNGNEIVTCFGKFS